MISYILERKEHLWISEHRCVFTHFSDFLERLPREILNDIFIMKDILFVNSTEQEFSLAEKYNLNKIVITTDMYHLLTKYSDGWVKAVLAHQIGYIHLQLNDRVDDDPLESLVDADKFACEMGYLDELEEFLYDQVESIEKRVRLSFITNYYFSNN